LSWVTRRTARHLADQEVIRSLWSLWTLVITHKSLLSWGRGAERRKSA